MRSKVREEERRNEAGQKGWQVNVNRTEQSKKLDKELADEIAEMGKDLAMLN